jgi:hypothetical protein
MAWFIGASITKVNNTCYVLRIANTWFGFWKIEDTHVFSSLAEAKAKLLEIRCKGELTIKE